MIYSASIFDVGNGSNLTLLCLRLQRMGGKMGKLKILLNDITYVMNHGENALPAAHTPNATLADHFLPTVQAHVIAECPPSPTPPAQPAVAPSLGGRTSVSSSSTASSRRSGIPPAGPARCTPESGPPAAAEKGSALQVSVCVWLCL